MTAPLPLHEQMAARLRERLAPTRLEVIDESALHAGHAGANGTGAGTHFRVRIACPAFDGLGRLALCFTAIGPSATLDPQPGGGCARTLQETARQLSSKLGARAK